MDQDLLLQIASGCASQHDLVAAGSSVFEAKTLTDVPQFRAVSKAPKPSDKPRTRSFVLSDETVDRVGDVIMAGGWQLDNYKANPVVLWGHNSYAPPIGTASRVRTARVDGRRALVGDLTLVDEEVNPHAEAIWRLVEAGVIRTVSVGFKPIKVRFGEEITDKERKKLGLSDWSVVYDESELLENSLVSVPANPNAVQLGLKDLVSKGILTDTQARAWMDEYPTTEEAALERARAAVRSVVDMGAVKTAPDEQAASDDSPEGDLTESPDSTDDAGDPVTKDAADLYVEDEDGDLHPVEDPDDLEVVEPDEEPEARSADATVPLVAALEKLTLAVAGVLEQHAESVAATRQLTDVVHDLARRGIDSPVDPAPVEPPTERTDAEPEDEVNPEQVASLLQKAMDSLRESRRPNTNIPS